MDFLTDMIGLWSMTCFASFFALTLGLSLAFLPSVFHIKWYPFLSFFCLLYQVLLIHSLFLNSSFCSFFPHPSFSRLIHLPGCEWIWTCFNSHFLLSHITTLCHEIWTEIGVVLYPTFDQQPWLSFTERKDVCCFKKMFQQLF